MECSFSIFIEVGFHESGFVGMELSDEWATDMCVLMIADKSANAIWIFLLELYECPHELDRFIFVIATLVEVVVAPLAWKRLGTMEEIAEREEYGIFFLFKDRHELEKVFHVAMKVGRDNHGSRPFDGPNSVFLCDACHANAPHCF